uniref:MADS-box domain-containing protein n=3 Tax=Ciona intestinalis TaxID=7719 RepID=F6SG85_CIOIN
MVRQTKNTFPRLFERSTPTVGKVDTNQQPDLEGRKKKKKSRMLKDIRSISDWERVFSSRKRTLMSKALELEHATGAIVTVTVRVSNNVYYYASSQVVKDILTKTPLLKGNSFHVTKKSLAIGLYGLTNACSDTESQHNPQPSTSTENRPSTSNNAPVTPIVTTPTRQPAQNGRSVKSPSARTALNTHQSSKHPPQPPIQSTPIRPDPPQINLTIASTSKTPPPTVPQVIIPSDSSSESSDS